MAFCTACGGSVESHNDYCYSCGCRIVHPETVSDAPPAEDVEPVEGTPQEIVPVVSESVEIVDVPKNQTKRKFDWKWIGIEVGMLALLVAGLWTIALLWAASGLSRHIPEGHLSFWLIAFVGIGWAIAIGVGIAVSRQGEQLKRNKKNGVRGRNATPIWMRLVGIGFMVTGLWMAYDFLKVALFFIRYLERNFIAVLTPFWMAPDMPPIGFGRITYDLVDGSVPNPAMAATLLAIFGIGFLARWGFHIAGLGGDPEFWAPR